MVGRTISHYQITQRLGGGGMGEIYRALDMVLNRRVAIKVLAAEHAGTGEQRRRFLQEAQAASALNHPNIITIHDVVSEGETQFIVMELVDGKTLAELIPKEGLPLPLVLAYAVQVADALEAAHRAGIVHRDLKPGNVMVTDAGLVKVLDFGLAKVISQTGPLVEDTRTLAHAPLTAEGRIMGTVAYMSPEQAEGKPVDARSDIFAFGAMLHEMVTGERAFSGDSAISILSSILRDEVRPLTRTAGVPSALENIAQRCLRKNREERWQSMHEVGVALAALKRDSDSGALLAPPLPPPPPPPPAMPLVRNKSRLPLAAALLGVLAAAGVGAWWAIGRRTPPAAPPPIQPAAAAPAVPRRQPTMAFSPMTVCWRWCGRTCREADRGAGPLLDDAVRSIDFRNHPADRSQCAGGCNRDHARPQANRGCSAAGRGAEDRAYAAPLAPLLPRGRPPKVAAPAAPRYPLIRGPVSRRPRRNADCDPAERRRADGRAGGQATSLHGGA